METVKTKHNVYNFLDSLTPESIQELKKDDLLYLKELVLAGQNCLVNDNAKNIGAKILKGKNGNEGLQCDQIRQAIDALFKIAEGDYNVRAPITGNSDDTDSLSMAINLLAEELEWNKHKLTTKNVKLTEKNYFISKITSAISSVIYLMETDNMNVVYSNKSLEEFIGYSDVKFAGEKIGKLLELCHPNDRENINRQLINSTGFKHNSKSSIELRLKAENNIWKWVSHELTPFRVEDDGTVTQVLGIISDITENKKKEERLRLNEERYRSLSETSTDAIIIADNNQKIVSWSKGAEDMFGYKQVEAIGSNIGLIVPEEYKEQHEIGFIKSVKTSETSSTGLTRELNGRKKHGDIFPIEINLSTWGNNAGHRYFSAVIRDISERKKFERELEKLSMVAKESRYSIILMDAEGNIEWVNRGFEKTTGYSADEVTEKSLTKLLIGDKTGNYEVIKINQRLADRQAVKGEIKYYRKNGSKFWCFYDIVPIFNAEGEFVNFVSTQIDITSRKLLEEELVNSNKEKDVMLKEIHHRVKNNLQIVNSLFDIQLGRNLDETLKDVLLNSKSRIKSISLIHEQLYMYEHLSCIDFPRYIKSLLTSIEISFLSRDQQVETVLNMEPIKVDLNTAIPLGLISNELLTNAFKHSFNKNKSGKITIDFKDMEGKNALIISDNGPGLPKDFKKRTNNSLGYKIIHSLVAQIDAKIKFESENGTKITITFDPRDTE